MFYELFKPKGSLGYHIVYVMGKGGVGKTTVSTALAYKLSVKGYRVLIVSLDPAHNLGDVLKTPLRDEPLRITENLWASEVDFDTMVTRYLKDLSEKLKILLPILNCIKSRQVHRHVKGVTRDRRIRYPRENT